jgi:hypothetical protein
MMSPKRIMPTASIANFNNICALSAATGPLTFTSTCLPLERNDHVFDPGIWLSSDSHDPQVGGFMVDHERRGILDLHKTALREIDDLARDRVESLS